MTINKALFSLLETNFSCLLVWMVIHIFKLNVCTICNFKQNENTLSLNIWIANQFKKQLKIVSNREKRALLSYMFTHKNFYLIVEINNSKVAIPI